MEVQPAPEVSKEVPTTVLQAASVIVNANEPTLTETTMDDEAEHDKLLENIDADETLGMVDAPFSSNVEGKMDGNVAQITSGTSITDIASKFNVFSSFAAAGSAVMTGDAKNWDWWSSFRSVTEFLAPSAFKKPASKGQLCARLTHNVPYYCTNYIMVWCVLLLFTVLTSPSLFVLMAMITYGWMWAQRQESLGFGSLAIAGKTKTIFVSSLATLAVLFFAGSSIVWIMCLTLGIAVLHASMHSLKDSEYGEVALESVGADEFGV